MESELLRASLKAHRLQEAESSTESVVEKNAELVAAIEKQRTAQSDMYVLRLLLNRNREWRF